MIFHLDIGSAQQVSSPKNFICAHQTKVRTIAAKKIYYCYNR